MIDGVCGELGIPPPLPVGRGSNVYPELGSDPNGTLVRGPGFSHDLGLEDGGPPCGGNPQVGVFIVGG